MKITDKLAKFESIIRFNYELEINKTLPSLNLSLLNNIKKLE